MTNNKTPYRISNPHSHLTQSTQLDADQWARVKAQLTPADLDAIESGGKVAVGKAARVWKDAPRPPAPRKPICLKCSYGEHAFCQGPDHCGCERCWGKPPAPAVERLPESDDNDRRCPYYGQHVPDGFTGCADCRVASNCYAEWERKQDAMARYEADAEAAMVGLTSGDLNPATAQRRLERAVLRAGGGVR